MASEWIDGDGVEWINVGDGVLQAMDGVERRTRSLTVGAHGFGAAMSRAFTQAATGGKQLDDVLKGLALRLSSMAVAQAFKPVASELGKGLNGLFEGLFKAGLSGGGKVEAAMGAVKPFAAGGVIGMPTYFPLTQGGVGLAGEAGPEAILPLARGADGRLGVAATGQGGASITVQIVTPDPQSFRRSETYIAGQIARAVARGQRNL